MIIIVGEVVAWLLVMAILVSQVIVPSVQGRPWFPALRRQRQRALEQELAEVEQESVEESLAAAVRARRAKLLEFARERERADGEVGDDVRGADGDAEVDQDGGVAGGGAGADDHGDVLGQRDR